MPRTLQGTEIKTLITYIVCGRPQGPHPANIPFTISEHQTQGLYGAPICASGNIHCTEDIWLGLLVIQPRTSAPEFPFPFVTMSLKNKSLFVRKTNKRADKPHVLSALNYFVSLQPGVCHHG